MPKTANRRTHAKLLEPSQAFAARPGAVHGLDTWAGRTKAGVPWQVRRGDAETVLATLEPDQFSCVVTSPPYYSQRDYQIAGQIGLEKTIDEYVDRVVRVFNQIRRVLAPDGVLFLNLGDTYYSAKGQPRGHDRKNGARRFGLRPVDASGLGVPRKTAIGIPWRVALAIIDGGWTLRCPIVWLRESSIPEPTAHDRPWRTHDDDGRELNARGRGQQVETSRSTVDWERHGALNRAS